MDKQHEEIHRKDFELYCKRNGFCIERGVNSGLYASLRTNDFWGIWLHSRANIVVELPEPMTEVVADTLIHGRVMANDMRTACAKALRSIGLSIKGEGV